MIPEGEKPDTFTGLALAPYEGCTRRGRVSMNKKQKGRGQQGELSQEFAAAKRIAKRAGLVTVYLGPEHTGDFTVSAWFYPTDHLNRSTEAGKLVQLFEDDSPRFTDWFNNWSKAPDILTLYYLLWAAEEMGVKLDAKSRVDAKHARNRALRLQVKQMWFEMKSEGVSKNDAARRIAEAVPLAETTIRKQLQGL